jgi:hypothetical protein
MKSNFLHERAVRPSLRINTARLFDHIFEHWIGMRRLIVRLEVKLTQFKVWIRAIGDTDR